MTHRVAINVSDLPEVAFGPRMTMWWGALAFCAVEGAGFAMVGGAYLYLAFINAQWPLSAPPPDLLWGGIFTFVLLASLVPNHFAAVAARRQDLRSVRLWLLVMAGIGLVLSALRLMEFTGLHIRWDTNAYGSTVWVLLGLHATHLVTDLADTLVLCALVFTRNFRGKRFSDAEDNAFYWNFVVAAWLPICALVYLFPRL